jgi:hypothetical protein
MLSNNVGMSMGMQGRAGGWAGGWCTGVRETLFHHLPLELLGCKLSGKLFVVRTAQHGSGSGGV